jgi:hypothetical protein
VTVSARSAHIDSWAFEARRSDTHGPDKELLVQSGSGVRRFAYVYAQRPWSDSRGVTVIAATLDLFVTRATPATAAPLQVRTVTGSWNEKVVSWASRPTVDPPVVATGSVPASSPVGTKVSIDVTTLLQAVVSGAPYYGVEISIDPATTVGPIRFASSEAANVDRRPLLTVTWSSAPDQPADLRPGSGRFLSIRKPVLAWSFGDVRDASAYQSAYRVQIDDVETFAAADYDSTQIASGVSQIDIGATAYAGLPTDGSIRYWRAQVWDDSGSISAYSDPVQIRYAPLGVVAITAPAATTPDIRPEVVWTFTPPAAPAGFGAVVQEAYRVTIERLDGIRWTLLADSGLVTSTALSYAPPIALSNLAATYRATVYVADSLDRESLPNAPALAKAVQTFTIAPSGTVVDPSGLTATVLNGYAVRLDWTRATRPDHWALEVNGVVLEDSIDVTPTGTAYTWTYYGVLPRKATTLKLHAAEIVGGAFVLSTGASVAVTTSPTGIWLVDPATGTAIHLADKDALQAEIGETSAVYPRLGERAPVVVTELVRGYEGSVSGALVAWDGQDPRAAKATAIALRELGGDLRLVLGDLNLPVGVFGMTANPTPRPGDTAFEVAFGFVQVAEFDRS